MNFFCNWKEESGKRKMERGKWKFMITTLSLLFWSNRLPPSGGREEGLLGGSPERPYLCPKAFLSPASLSLTSICASIFCDCAWNQAVCAAITSVVLITPSLKPTVAQRRFSSAYWICFWAATSFFSATLSFMSDCEI